MSLVGGGAILNVFWLVSAYFEKNKYGKAKCTQELLRKFMFDKSEILIASNSRKPPESVKISSSSPRVRTGF